MLTPIELQGKVFKTGFGYDKKDVEAFLKEVVDDYEALYKDNLELNDKINVLSEGVQYYKTIEKTLQKALVLAEKTAQDTEAAATKRAEELVSEAEKKAALIQEEALAKADSITNNALHDAKSIQLDARKTLDQIQLQISSLVQQFEHYKIQYRQLLATQTELMESDSFMIDFTSLKKELSSDYQESTSNSDSEDTYEENDMKQQNQYIIRNIAPEESLVYNEDAANTKATTDEDTIDNVSVKENTSVEDDFMPTIDLASIMEEARKEIAEEEGQSDKEEYNETETPSLTFNHTEPEENTDYDYDGSKQEELSEQDLLQQLFSVNPKKKSNKKKNSEDSDDFEFLDI